MSDWDRFFSTCAASETYRNALSEALLKDDEEGIRRLLREIDIADTEDRIAALRALNRPFRQVFDAFGEQPRFVPAP